MYDLYLSELTTVTDFLEWMVDFWKGKKISRPPGPDCTWERPLQYMRNPDNFPTVSRVPEERVLKSLYFVVDDAFSSPDHEDLRFLARAVVNQLLAATTVPAIVYALDEAAQLNARALHAFGGNELSLFTTPSTSLTESPTQTPPAPPADGRINVDEVSRRLKSSTRNAPNKQRQSQPAGSTSYFSFTIMQRPETLLVAWPVSTTSQERLYWSRFLILFAPGRVRRHFPRGYSVHRAAPPGRAERADLYRE